MMSEIVAEMAEAGLEPDAKERQLLSTAAELVDRMAALEIAIAADGEILRSPTGVVKVHPAVAEHRQLAATLPKVLVGVVVGDTVSAPGKNVVKQRAANVRWDKARALRERQVADG